MLRRILVITIASWFVITTTAAYVYVSSRIALPGIEGYEQAWDWQLFFFFITRFPFYLAALLLILFMEKRLLSKRFEHRP